MPDADEEGTVIRSATFQVF